MKRFLLIFSAFVLVIAAVLHFRKSHIITYEAAVSEFVTDNSHFTEWNGVKLHYIDQGEGVPVMLLHGYAGSFDNWRLLVQEFPGNYRLIIPDLPGSGLSQFPDDTGEEVDLVDLYCDFSSHIIEELNLDSLYMVGNSLGGFLAWETTLRNPEKVKKLVLLNAAGYSIDDIGAFFIKFSQTVAFKRIVKKGAPKFVARKAAKGTLGDKSRLDEERLNAFYGMVNKEGNLDVIGKLGNSKQRPDSLRILNIEAPSLIIWGNLDGIIPVDHAYKFDRDIPNSELIIYNGTGHVPMLEEPERLTKDLIAFFEK